MPKAALTKWLEQAGVEPDAVTDVAVDEAEMPPVDGNQQRGSSGDTNGATSPEPSPVLNLTKVLNDERDKVNKLGRQAINVRFRQEYGDYTVHRSKYSKVAARFWSDHFSLVSLPRAGTKLSEIDDLDTLKAIYDNIRRELRNRRP